MARTLGRAASKKQRAKPVPQDREEKLEDINREIKRLKSRLKVFDQKRAAKKRKK